MLRLGYVVERRPTNDQLDHWSGTVRDEATETLDRMAGRWVAQRGREILFTADSPQRVASWLSRHRLQARGVARSGDSRRGGLGAIGRAVIVRYTELPDATLSPPRPLVDLAVAGMESALIPCLVDCGATNTLLAEWAAELAGVDLGGTATRRFGVGGATIGTRFAPVSLSAAGHTWEAEVGFCDPWPYAWGLVGHDSFFRWFTVTFRAADLEFELDPLSS